MQQNVTDRDAWLDAVEIGSVDAPGVEQALDVAAHAMCDNPLTVAAFGTDPEQRRQRLRRFMGGAATALGWGPDMLVARGADGTIAGMQCDAPGQCLTSPSKQPRVLPTLLSNGPPATRRAMRWLGP